MNVCIYTRDNTSTVNLLNINHLINSRPQHNYSFISIKNDPKKLTLQEKLRKVYIEARANDGRFDFYRDVALIDERLKQHLHAVDRKSFYTEGAFAVNDAKSEDYLTKIKPDVVIQAGAGILAENIFSKARIATINIHHGLAPQIRGIESTFWCMFYGIRESIGVTCHFIDEHLDTGAIISQKPLITSANSFIDIQTENYIMGRNILVDSLDILEHGNYKIVDKGKIKSYYFGLVDPFLYYALKKRLFHPLMTISQKNSKMKDLKLVERA